MHVDWLTLKIGRYHFTFLLFCVLLFIPRVLFHFCSDFFELTRVILVVETVEEAVFDLLGRAHSLDLPVVGSSALVGLRVQCVKGDLGRLNLLSYGRYCWCLRLLAH